MANLSRRGFFGTVASLAVTSVAKFVKVPALKPRKQNPEWRELNRAEVITSRNNNAGSLRWVPDPSKAVMLAAIRQKPESITWTG